ncbi:hypothetical protein XHV734_4470 [Xanthomonas hortorum pv. vitians]|nr:hypothetical protein XHV734_4470 [Xanthomonas hortorum pv. vitians]
MNWMRAPEALDIAANIHFPYLTAFVFRMDCVRADKQGLTKGGLIRPGFPRHLKAMENGRFGGVYEQQAVYG